MLAVVRQYLTRQFPDATITILDAPDRGQHGFEVQWGKLCYRVAITQELQEQTDAATLAHQLDEWQVFETMCAAEDMTLLLTPHGVRLNSSN